MQHKEGIAAITVHYLEEALGLVAQLTDASYTRKEPPLYTGSVGAHLRHMLDHYLSLLDGLAEGRIDYEARKRDARFEQEREYAIEQIRETVARLNALSADDADRPLQVRMEAGVAGDGEPIWATSSLRRELDFLISHTIHHYGLIAIILRTQGVDPGPDFGMAPSTLRYQRTSSSCAR